MTVRHLERIREALGDAGADALWIHPAIDFRYLTGLAAIAMERPTALEADAAMAWVAGAELDGRSERWLALELQMRFLRRGADAVRLRRSPPEPTPRCRTTRPGDTPIRADAPLLTDFGCVVGGYYSDMTRVHLPARAARPPRPTRSCRAAHDAVIAGLEPGLPCHEADRLARAVIEAAGYGERFIHRTGHGVGLEIHEEPYLRPGQPGAAGGRPRLQRRAGHLRSRPLRGPLREPRAPRPGRPRAARTRRRIRLVATRVTELLHCDHPIQLAPMGSVSVTAALPLAVAAAGGHGMYSVLGLPPQALAPVLDALAAGHARSASTSSRA